LLDSLTDELNREEKTTTKKNSNRLKKQILSRRICWTPVCVHVEKKENNIYLRI